MSIANSRLGALLMTYGSPASLDDVPRYLTSIRGGREPSSELVTEFQRRYAAIGGSPLVEITRAQAAATERALAGRVRVRAAMRHSTPTIAEAVEDLARNGAEAIIGVIMSPQSSPLLMGGYEAALENARKQRDDTAISTRVAGAWYAQEQFIKALARRIANGLAEWPASSRGRVTILLTAHSLPRRVADEEPGYLAQLEDTARLVAREAQLSADRWAFCWQSAGHEPGEWMKPDFADLMPALRAAGHEGVLVAPVQFLADHLEILYDIDIAAAAQAAAAGLEFRRIRSLNVDGGLIAALASVISRELES